MDKKLGLYVCTGCDIGDAVDVDKLVKEATEEVSVPITKTHPCLCGPEGVKLIRSDIASEGINAICVAACSQRVMADVFRFDGCVVERANLREQVVWCHPAQDEDTQMMAEDYVKMGLAKLQNAELPEPYKPEAEMSRAILVVGGGLAGLTAAQATARAGYETVLVEKQKKLGGFQRKVRKIATLPYSEIEDNTLDELVRSVSEDDRIKVYTDATVEKTEGGPALFDVTIKQNGTTTKHRAGAIVMAAGWMPYDPAQLPEKLGYGRSPDVITNVSFEERFGKGSVKRPSSSKSVKNVAFLQCAGQRDPDHLPYCSSVCCTMALKQAITVKEQSAETNVFVVYKELRTPAQAENLYRLAQEMGVGFIRCQDPEVRVGKGKKKALTVVGKDDLLGQEVELGNLDLVVLATGMVPVTTLGEDVNATERVECEKQREKAGDLVLLPDVIRKSDILNLDYRQGPELPSLHDDFPDSHFVCFPYESRRTGVYATGCVRRPQNRDATIKDATGAALKAIQCVELTHEGAAVHPRALDLSFPDFHMMRCTQCKRCTVECPFGAINEDEKGNPLLNATRCRRCGVCMGACPERIVSFKNYSVPMVADMIRSISMPEEIDEKPRIIVFACENDAIPALDMVGLKRLSYNAWVRVIPLRCLGSMNQVWIADSLSKGVDGVLLLGCRHGDDYQCHFIRGSELSRVRLSKLGETLQRLALESERVRYETVAITDYPKLPGILDDFAKEIEEIGANPFKEFQ